MYVLPKQSFGRAGGGSCAVLARAVTQPRGEPGRGPALVGAKCNPPEEGQW